jgi:histidine triad (HIT) family protein
MEGPLALHRMATPAPCIFCAIVRGEVPGHLVLSGRRCVAFLDIHPLSRGHTLVVPRAHAADLTQVSVEDWAEATHMAHSVALQLRKALGAQGNNLFVASGTAAEQSVRHLHIHVVPRYAGDGLDLNEWWTMKVQPASPEALEKLAKELRGTLGPQD